ncbi:hypothetical protein [Streptomyces caniferus]|uniref:hypothetical protein n=1 Tax=Streptomyces caniferus TaxID=285557 RepID=UPI0037FD9B28
MGKHLVVAVATAMLVGGVAVAAPARAVNGSARSTAPPSVLAAPAAKGSTTLWIHGKGVRVWKTWYHHRGGGYDGHFGATSVPRGTYAFAEINWNSGRHTIVPVKVHTTHVYRGAKSVYLRACVWERNNLWCGSPW